MTLGSVPDTNVSIKYSGSQHAMLRIVANSRSSCQIVACSIRQAIESEGAIYWLGQSFLLSLQDSRLRV